jgi:hypothetical protein
VLSFASLDDRRTVTGKPHVNMFGGRLLECSAKVIALINGCAALISFRSPRRRGPGSLHYSRPFVYQHLYATNPPDESAATLSPGEMFWPLPRGSATPAATVPPRRKKQNQTPQIRRERTNSGAASLPYLALFAVCLFFFPGWDGLPRRPTDRIHQDKTCGRNQREGRD